MYKPSLSTSPQALYRWQVFARCLLAIVAGFLMASLTVPIVAYSLPQPLGIATFTGMLLSFVVWLGYIIFVFSCKTIAKLGIISLIILLVMAGLAYGLKYWSGV